MASFDQNDGSEAFEAKVRQLREHFHRITRKVKAVDVECLGQVRGDLSMPEMRVIEVLGDFPGCMMRELADQMLAAVSTATGLVDKLVQKGLVRRERVDEDRRVVRAELSETGREVYESVMTMHFRFCRDMLATLNEDEQEIYLVLMKKIARGLGESISA